MQTFGIVVVDRSLFVFVCRRVKRPQKLSYVQQHYNQLTFGFTFLSLKRRPVCWTRRWNHLTDEHPKKAHRKCSSHKEQKTNRMAVDFIVQILSQCLSSFAQCTDVIHCRDELITVGKPQYQQNKSQQRTESYSYKSLATTEFYSSKFFFSDNPTFVCHKHVCTHIINAIKFWKIYHDFYDAFRFS